MRQSHLAWAYAAGRSHSNCLFANASSGIYGPLVRVALSLPLTAINAGMGRCYDCFSARFICVH